MSQSANIQVEVGFKSDRRAGNTYQIETTITYDPLRANVEIHIRVSRLGFAGAMPEYTYEREGCQHQTAASILELLEPDDLLWSMAVGVSRGNENAKRILDENIDRILGLKRKGDEAHVN